MTGLLFRVGLYFPLATFPADSDGAVTGLCGLRVQDGDLLSSVRMERGTVASGVMSPPCCLRGRRQSMTVARLLDRPSIVPGAPPVYQAHHLTQEMDARIAFSRKLFASHEIKVLPSGDRAVAKRLLLATGRLHDVIANEIE